MRLKCYVTILFSHLAVLIALVIPIIRVSEVRMSLNREADSVYLNIFEYVDVNLNTLSTVIMLVLAFMHILGLGNAIFGILKKKYSHLSINLTFLCGFASALMGALQLYSKSYVLFSICAVTYLTISFCSIKLIKSEG